MAKRTFTVSIDEKVAREIEKLTKVPVQQLAGDLLNGFLDDGRRRQIPMIALGISWPPDWYAMMLKVWGENKIAGNVRNVLHKFMMKDPHRGKWVPSDVPELRNRTQIRVTKRKIRQRVDGNTYIGQTIIPEDWNNWLNEHYPKKRSTYVKLAIYTELCTWPWPRGTSPSVPQGLMKFVNNYL